MAAALAALVSGALVAVFWMAAAYDDLGKSSAERMIADGLRDFEVEETGEVTGDPLAFRQIAVNLIGNALKFTDDGHVRVGLSAVRNGALVSFRLEVADTGPGVPEASRARIFERIERGEAAECGAAGGVGLGLAITRSLLEMMGGSVEVSEAPEGGALFSPIVPPPAAGAAPKAEAA